MSARANVRLPNYIALHELFDEIAGEFEDYSDRIASWMNEGGAGDSVQR